MIKSLFVLNDKVEGDQDHWLEGYLDNKNFSGDFSDNVELIKLNLINQLTGSVKWVNVMNKIKELNLVVIECGPGKVLQGIGRSNGLSDILISSNENLKSNLKDLL